jgi:hypothetical protein
MHGRVLCKPRQNKAGSYTTTTQPNLIYVLIYHWTRSEHFFSVLLLWGQFISSSQQPFSLTSHETKEKGRGRNPWDWKLEGSCTAYMMQQNLDRNVLQETCSGNEQNAMNR